MNRITTIIAVLALGLFVAASVAVASEHQGAQNKHGHYESESEADAGIVVLDPELLALFRADSQAETTKDEPARAESSAGHIYLFGEPLPPFGVSCEAVGDPDEGVDRDEQEETLLDEEFEGSSLTLLRSYCEARAVKHNNAMGRSENTAAEVNLGGEVHARVLQSESDTKTTSGQARSSSRFTGAEAQAGGVEVKAIDCEARSFDTHGTDRDETSGMLLTVGDEGIDDPGLCELFVGSEADHER